jgi:hypothetical protein
MALSASKRSKLHPEKKSPGCMIALASMLLIPLVLILLAMVPRWMAPEPTQSVLEFRAKKASAAQAGREAVSEIIEKSGGEYSIAADGAQVITLSQTEALTISERAAKETALLVASRTGSRARVVTPAGQVLAEAP